jgi:hypothetical protein
MHIACGDFLFRGKIIARLFRCSCLAAKNHTVIRLLACSRAHDGSVPLPTFYQTRGSAYFFVHPSKPPQAVVPAAVFAHTGEKTLLDENGRFSRGGPESAVPRRRRAFCAFAF